MGKTPSAKNLSACPDFYIAAAPTPLGKRSDAFAAFRLSRIVVRGKAGPEEAAGLAAFYRRHIDLLQNLWRENEDLAYELSYRFIPDEGGRPGQVIAAMRARVSAGERAAAIAGARNAARGLLPSLTALSSGHYWTPVVNKADYRAIFPAARFKHSAEIVRQRLRVQVPGEGAGSGDDRYCPTPGGASREAVSKAQLAWLPLVRPFNPRLDSWENLFITLLSGAAPVVLSVAVAPTRLGEGEAAWLRGTAARCEAALWSESPNGAAVVRASAQAAVAQILESQRVLSDKAFLLRVQVASPKPLLPGVAEAVGTAISDPADAPEMRAPVHQEARLVRGGFAVIRPEGAGQQVIALRNLSRVGFDLWGPSAFPSEALRFERLAGTAEAAAAFRLPAPIPGRFPGLPSETARIVDFQAQSDPDGVFLGLGWTRGRRSPVRIGLEDRRKNIYAVGKTGTGKTTFLHNLAVQDIAAGHGVCILDPHGDLTARVYADIPEARRQDVVLVDLSTENHEFGLNILEPRGAGYRERAVDMLMSVFSELWNMRECGGPIFEMGFRACTLIALSGEGPATLLDVQKVICDKDFRDARLANCDAVVRSTWQDVISQAGGESSWSNLRPYLLSKLNKFMMDAMVRRIVSKEKSTLDFADAMARRQVILINLGKGGVLGPTNSAFLGMLLSNQIMTSALARPRTQENLSDFFVYVDEFQNFTTPSFATMLAENRKYRVNLVLANQHIGQLRSEVGQALLGNVGGLVAFRTGPADAEALAGHMAPQFGANDLMGLSIGRCCASLLMGGSKAEPFTLDVCPAPVMPA